MPSRPPSTPQHIAETVDAMVALHSRALASVNRHQRSVEWVTGKLGRPATIYALAASVLGWVLLNVLLPHFGRRPIDPPPFAWLQGTASTLGLFVATMVLTTQNRLAKHGDQRSQLDLQVNLAADAKIAKLISLLEELRRDLPSVPNRVDRVADEMKVATDPEKMLVKLEQTLEES